MVWPLSTSHTFYILYTLSPFKGCWGLPISFILSLPNYGTQNTFKLLLFLCSSVLNGLCLWILGLIYLFLVTLLFLKLGLDWKLRIRYPASMSLLYVPACIWMSACECSPFYSSCLPCWKPTPVVVPPVSFLDLFHASPCLPRRHFSACYFLHSSLPLAIHPSHHTPNSPYSPAGDSIKSWGANRCPTGAGG